MNKFLIINELAYGIRCSYGTTPCVDEYETLPKKCKSCDKIKKITNFKKYKTKDGKEKRLSICAKCRSGLSKHTIKKLDKEYISKNSESIIQSKIA